MIRPVSRIKGYSFPLDLGRQASVPDQFHLSYYCDIVVIILFTLERSKPTAPHHLYIHTWLYILKH